MKKETLKQLIQEVVKEVGLSENNERSQQHLKGFIGKTIKDIDYDYYGGTMTIYFQDAEALNLQSRSNGNEESWISVS